MQTSLLPSKGQEGSLRELQASQPHNVIPGKVTEQLILQAICKQVKNKKVIASREHRLKNGKPCLTNPIMLYDETTSLRGELWILSTLTSVWLSTLPPIRLS